MIWRICSCRACTVPRRILAIGVNHRLPEDGIKRFEPLNSDADEGGLTWEYPPLDEPADELWPFTVSYWGIKRGESMKGFQNSAVMSLVLNPHGLDCCFRLGSLWAFCMLKYPDFAILLSICNLFYIGIIFVIVSCKLPPLFNAYEHNVNHF